METINRRQWKELLTEAMKGKPEAQWMAGFYHEHGAAEAVDKVVIRQDPLKAVQWYTLAAEQGYAPAQVALGVLLSDGDELARNLDAAIFWTQKAVDQGDAAAASNLARIYRDLQKPAKSFRWYRQAVSMGDTDALLELALCYLFGYGTRKNPAAAYDCLRTILDGDQTRSTPRTKENALYWLAVLNLLEVGGLKRSLKRARQLLEAANRDGDHEQAHEILNLIGQSRYLDKQE
jgi:TPR repeat protein